MRASEQDAQRVPEELRAGCIFDGKYEVECVLGMGGMGVVLLARDVVLSRHVALKVLLPDRVKEERHVARFLREGRAAALISGEHVCRVLEVSRSRSGLPYMVLEWLVGRNLDEICDEEGPIDPHLAVDYVLQASEAVAQAHARGIVHRDIKPANLFLTQTPDGAPLVKVLDFGISKVTEKTDEEVSALTKTGVLIGSPRYMAPEQMKNPSAVDARADIWGFGAVLFKLVIGRPPFLAASVAELFASVIHDPAPRASALREDVPLGLDEAIRRCLEKDPANRFQTLDGLAEAIAPFASRAEDGALSAGRIKAIHDRGSITDERPAGMDERTTVDPPPALEAILEMEARGTFQIPVQGTPVQRTPVQGTPVQRTPPRPIPFVSDSPEGDQRSNPIAPDRRRMLMFAAAIATLIIFVGSAIAVGASTSQRPTIAAPLSAPLAPDSAPVTPSVPEPIELGSASTAPVSAAPSAAPSVAPSPTAPGPSLRSKRPLPAPKNQTTTSDRHG
jgi:serine/threonine protein kinase